MKRILIVLFVLLGTATSLMAQIPERPVPARLVNDFAGVLTNDQREGLENALEKFARETSTQIVVVAVPDLEGYDKADYAFQLGEKWGVGQKGKDNGIVILLKPKTGNSRGEVFIATGYGLEGVLPDATVNRDIVSNEMLPRFKENNYYEGLAAGIGVIMDITRGEYTADEYRQQAEAGGAAGIPFLIILFAVLISLFGRSRRRRFYSPGRSLPFWMAMGMMSGSHRSSGSFGNFSSGGGSFGGFGGFGGGSFGGGGAGGSW
ncbi:TPM domain-containing protein [Maribellus sp. YY47]|uniref:TPM domain-containing protein n=1 Tax=Maribellus sp. YY47 TaxID=2929486 RepID=UPI0020010B6E|nr:TPM domain-containing protein [Maribellus sp. YY47]MCK3686008.1 TPM domain-containing protein [Maribellus sp. YY47]